MGVVRSVTRAFLAPYARATTAVQVKSRVLLYLLALIVAIQIAHCARCQGPTTWLEVATEPDAIDQAMADHGLGPHRARPPPLFRRPPAAQLALPL